MSGQNLAYVRATYAEWERGNFAAGPERFHPDIHFEPFMPDAVGLVARGLPEVGRFMSEFLGNWEDYRLFGDEFVEASDDVILVEGHQTARGKHSGVMVRDVMCSLWTFEDSLVVRLVIDRDCDALRRSAQED